MRNASNVVTAILLFTSMPAAASLQPSNQTIVVKATPLAPEQARQRAVEFVKSTGVANGQKQVARWAVPICIKVAGISTSQTAKIQDLMLGVAREANMPVARQGCEPNITVIFTGDAGQAVRYVHQHRPHQLRELSFAAREQLLTGNAPVRWWYSTQNVDREGVGTDNVAPVFATAGTTGGQVGGPVSVGGMGEMTSTQQYGSGSNVRTPTIRSLFSATVVIDAPAAGTTPVDSIAAYAAMVAFAEMDAGAPPPDSILGLFQPSSVENSLTDWDMAFLKSLYRMPLDRRSRIQRGHLVEALLDERLPTDGETKKP
jgi:hypothetical protein